MATAFLFNFGGGGWWNFQIYFLTTSKQRHDISSTDGSTEALVDWKSDKLYVAKHFTVMQRWKAKAGTASNVTLLLLRKFHMTLWHDQQKRTTKPRKTHKFLFFISRKEWFLCSSSIYETFGPHSHIATWVRRHGCASSHRPKTSSCPLQNETSKLLLSNISFCADFR